MVRLSERSRFMWSDLSGRNEKFLNLIQVGWNSCRPNSSYSHFKDMYIIHVIKNGACTIEIGGHRYTLGKDEAFLVRPNQLTIQTTDSNTACEMCYFAFKGDYSKEILSKTSFGNGFYSTVSDRSIYDLIKKVAIDLNNHDKYEFLSLEYLFKMLSFFDKNNIEVTTNKLNNDFAHQKCISQIQKYIHENYTKEIRVSELASRLGLSRSHLFRVFKNYTGKSIEDYIISVRINAARSLLIDTDLSCSAIAISVGYTHYTTFFKMFKAATGYTPQQYRTVSRKDVNIKK